MDVNQQLVFLEQPDHFNPKIHVAACFMTVDERILFLKRQPYKSEGNLWGIPGGCCGEKESAEQTVIREVKEETTIDLTLRPLDYLGKVYIRYPELDFAYYMFAQDYRDYPKEIIISPEEHQEFRWMTLNEALKLPLIRGEAECIYLIYGKDLSNKKEERFLFSRCTQITNQFNTSTS